MVKKIFLGLLLSASLVNMSSYSMDPTRMGQSSKEEEFDIEDELQQKREELRLTPAFERYREQINRQNAAQNLAQENPKSYTFEEKLDEDFVDRAYKHVSEDVKDIVHKLATHKKFDFIIFVGPPGSGKSTLAKVVAQKSGRKYAFIHAASLLTKYQNCGNENLRNILNPIIERKEKCVVVLDEITQLTRSSSSKDDVRPEADAAGALWSIVDEYKKHPFLVIIGTTNSLDGVPEALQDRVTYIIHIPRADREARKEAIEKLLGKNHACTPKYIAYLAKQSQGQSYREVERVIEKATIRAERLKETLGESHIKPLIKEWYSPYNPLFIYQQSKKHAKPFFKEVLPVVLQAVGLGTSNYFSVLQGRSSARQVLMQAEGLEAQKDGLVLQKTEISGWDWKAVAKKLGIGAVGALLAKGAEKGMPIVIEMLKKSQGS